MSQSGVFQRTRIVQSQDIDGLGHVNNAVWVTFIVELAEAHSTSVGLGWKELRKLGGLWLVTRHEVDYLRSGLPGEELLEETWVAEMHGARSLRRARFTRAADGTELVSAATWWAYVNPGTQRPTRIHPQVRSSFPLVEADPAPISER